MLPGPAAALVLALALLAGPPGPPGDEHVRIRGVTVSCQTWGWEWGTDGFADELAELDALGANWVAIHPYAYVRQDGSLRWRPLDPDAPPEWIARPIAEAHARGMAILVKPHVGYWGSGFAWRGAIRFDDPAARERFFADYARWIEAVAAAAAGADGFAVGTELDLLVEHEDAWRDVVARVRRRFDGPLTYAANWDAFERVPFWDALDAIGVQAYFPLAAGDDPDEAALRAGWREPLERLRALSERTGKPVVFTELGYDASPEAARRPWEGAPRGAARDDGAALQRRCLAVALDVLEREGEWLRGAFLWKWFVGASDGANFVLDEPGVRAVLRTAWGG